MAKKVIIANPEPLSRLRAIEMLQSGKSQKEVAAEFNVHQTTIGEWLRMYEEEGTERLKAPMKPRPRNEMSIEQLEKLVGNISQKYVPRINALIELARTKKLNETAAMYGVTAQGLAKWRREYLAGKWPI